MKLLLELQQKDRDRNEIILKLNERIEKENELIEEENRRIEILNEQVTNFENKLRLRNEEVESENRSIDNDNDNVSNYNDAIEEENKRLAINKHRSIDVVCIIAVWGRNKAVRANVELLSRQTKKVFTILIVSTEEDQNLAKELKEKYRNQLDYIFSVNQPLGLKWQNGIAAARRFSPKAVLINGSDDLLSINWVNRCFREIQEGYDQVGKNKWYFYDVKNRTIYSSKYIHAQVSKDKTPYTVGAGRMISAKILDKLDWNLYPIEKPKGLDTHSLRTLLANGAKVKIINDENIFMISVKGDWDMITNVNKIKKANTVRTMKVKDPRIINKINSHFRPENGIIDFLRKHNIV